MSLQLSLTAADVASRRIPSTVHRSARNRQILVDGDVARRHVRIARQKRRRGQTRYPTPDDVGGLVLDAFGNGGVDPIVEKHPSLPPPRRAAAHTTRSVTSRLRPVSDNTAPMSVSPRPRPHIGNATADRAEEYAPAGSATQRGTTCDSDTAVSGTRSFVLPRVFSALALNARLARV